MDAIENNASSIEETRKGPAIFESTKYWIAGIILVLYAAFIIFLLIHSNNSKELVWTRMLYLFTGFEAIVFAALGFVFGKDIHRVRAQNAEKDAAQAKQETQNVKKESDVAKENAQMEREKGIQLGAAVMASRKIQKPVDQKGFVGSAAINHTPDYVFDLAKKLYPSINTTEGE